VGLEMTLEGAEGRIWCSKITALNCILIYSYLCQKWTKKMPY